MWAEEESTMKKARGPSEVDRKTNFRIIIFSLSPFPLYISMSHLKATQAGDKKSKKATQIGGKGQMGKQTEY